MGKDKEYPVIQIKGALSKNLVTAVTKKQIMKKYEAEMRKNEAPIIEYCQQYLDKKQIEENIKTGNFDGVYKVVTKIKNKEVDALFITTDRFSVPQDEETHKEIKKHLGKNYEDVVEKKVTITMKDEVFENKELQKELREALGKNFEKYFDTNIRYEIKTGFNKKIFEIAKNFDVLSKIRSFISQAKPSLK